MLACYEITGSSRYHLDTLVKSCSVRQERGVGTTPEYSPRSAARTSRGSGKEQAFDHSTQNTKSITAVSTVVQCASRQPGNMPGWRNKSRRAQTPPETTGQRTGVIHIAQGRSGPARTKPGVSSNGRRSKESYRRTNSYKPHGHQPRRTQPLIAEIYFPTVCPE